RVGAALGRQANLHGAFTAGVGAQTGSRNAHLFDGVDPGRSKSEEACAAAFEALRIVVHAIERDVQRGIRQTVEGAVPIAGGAHVAGDQRSEVETVPTVEGQVLDQVVADRAPNFIRGRVELLSTSSHLDRLRGGADFQID